MLLIVFLLLVTTIVNLYLISSESFADGQGWVWWRMISKIERADAVCASSLHLAMVLGVISATSILLGFK